MEDAAATGSRLGVPPGGQILYFSIASHAALGARGQILYFNIGAMLKYKIRPPPGGPLVPPYWRWLLVAMVV
jgi:hypothetical protein